jgi:anti-sigma regulatory factor (Ser/Thr protein kinase)
MQFDAFLSPAPLLMSRSGAPADDRRANAAVARPVAIALDADTDAPTRARRAVAEALRDWRPDQRDALLLVVSELVTNAVRHGSCDRRDRIALAVRHRDGATRIEVTDSGARGRAVEEVEYTGAAQRSGWGLPIVAELTDRWGVERGPGRTCVWCEIDDL